MEIPSHFARVFDRLENLVDRGKYWSARCPAHDDNVNSLSVSVGEKGNLILNCHGPAGCKFQDIAKALGLKASELFADSPEATQRKIDRTYSYYHEDGTLAYECVRWLPKAFSFRAPNPNYERDNKRWLWELPDDVRLVLYRLPQLLTSIRDHPDRDVFLLEGEKDVETAVGLGLIATTVPMGAKKWRPEYTEALRGASVNIIYDLDKYQVRNGERAGLAHGLKVARSIYGVAKRVRLVRLPFPTSEERKYDFTDWSEQATGDRDAKRKALWELLKATPYYYPGWEYDSDFQRWQNNALDDLRAGGRADLDHLRRLTQDHIAGFFDGLRLAHMGRDAARCAATMQYFMEEMMGLTQRRVDPHEAPPPVAPFVIPPGMTAEEAELMREQGII